jgi:hypothetical protein
MVGPKLYAGQCRPARYAHCLQSMRQKQILFEAIATPAAHNQLSGNGLMIELYFTVQPDVQIFEWNGTTLR